MVVAACSATEVLQASCSRATLQIPRRCRHSFIQFPCCYMHAGFKALCDAFAAVSGECKPYSITGSLPCIRDLQEAGFDVQTLGFGKLAAYHSNNGEHTSACVTSQCVACARALLVELCTRAAPSPKVAMRYLHEVMQPWKNHHNQHGPLQVLHESCSMMAQSLLFTQILSLQKMMIMAAS